MSHEKKEEELFSGVEEKNVKQGPVLEKAGHCIASMNMFWKRKDNLI